MTPVLTSWLNSKLLLYESVTILFSILKTKLSFLAQFFQSYFILKVENLFLGHPVSFTRALPGALNSCGNNFQFEMRPRLFLINHTSNLCNQVRDRPVVWRTLKIVWFSSVISEKAEALTFSYLSISVG